jgi:hypothetical protein
VTRPHWTSGAPNTGADTLCIPAASGAAAKACASRMGVDEPGCDSSEQFDHAAAPDALNAGDASIVRLRWHTSRDLGLWRSRDLLAAAVYCPAGVSATTSVALGLYTTGGSATTRTGQNECEAGFTRNGGVREGRSITAALSVSEQDGIEGILAVFTEVYTYC